MVEVWICEMEDVTWRFSTEQLARKCAQFFDCEETAAIYCEKDFFDDDELLKRIKAYKIVSNERRNKKWIKKL